MISTGLLRPEVELWFGTFLRVYWGLIGSVPPHPGATVFVDFLRKIKNTVLLNKRKIKPFVGHPTFVRFTAITGKVLM